MLPEVRRSGQHCVPVHRARGVRLDMFAAVHLYQHAPSAAARTLLVPEIQHALACRGAQRGGDRLAPIEAESAVNNLGPRVVRHARESLGRLEQLGGRGAHHAREGGGGGVGEARGHRGEEGVDAPRHFVRRRGGLHEEDEVRHAALLGGGALHDVPQLLHGAELVEERLRDQVGEGARPRRAGGVERAQLEHQPHRAVRLVGIGVARGEEVAAVQTRARLHRAVLRRQRCPAELSLEVVHDGGGAVGVDVAHDQHLREGGGEEGVREVEEAVVREVGEGMQRIGRRGVVLQRGLGEEPLGKVSGLGGVHRVGERVEKHLLVRREAIGADGERGEDRRGGREERG
mmetsp:Transcript_36804/g.89622  ORF Transcript_36804/g.89622 Transcript_36804/m.89622 type:complete len:345 (+) Transcript_36804:201-1235(+)